MSQHQPIHFYKAREGNALYLLYALISFDLTIILGQNLNLCPTNNKHKDVDYVKVPNSTVFLGNIRAFIHLWIHLLV